jgi:nicotinate-nucleotide--dimethylbenzimidazole phosphoribosyltransferase
MFARQVGATVLVIDVGVAGEPPAAAGLVTAKYGRGLDLTVGPAMTERQAIENRHHHRRAADRRWLPLPAPA